jgi:hypothetical protein
MVWYQQITWEDEQLTQNILISNLVLAFVIYTAVYFIPLDWFRYICLLGGNFAFLMTTRWFRSTSLQFLLMAGEYLKITYKEKIVPLVTKKKYRDNDLVTVELFENQRWWAGLGWIPFLLKTERSAWSDEQGTVSYAHINDYRLPSGVWEWVDNNWKLDENWSSVGMDEQGWQYLDNSWQNPRGRVSFRAFTRRRCWMRRMRCIQAPVRPDSEIVDTASRATRDMDGFFHPPRRKSSLSMVISPPVVGSPMTPPATPRVKEE